MISIECFKGLPIQYESFLIQKYDSFVTTCRYIEIYYNTYNIHYMLVKDSNNLVDLLVFGNKGNAAVCFNSISHIDKDIMDSGLRLLFEVYPTVQRVEIMASYARYNFRKSYVISQSNDYIIDLPSTMDEYISRLGQSTRKNIRNLSSKFSRDYPEARHITLFGEDIRKEIVSEIIALNINRMKSKGIMPGRSESDIVNTYLFSKHYGCVSYIEVNGTIVAGNISFLIGNRIFASVIAHDNNFSKYNVGRICQLNIIQTAIDKKMSTFHFLWGDNEYKKRLLGEPRALYSYCVHRNYYNDYILRKMNALMYLIMIRIRHSKYSKPFKEAIKNYRKNKWKESLPTFES